MSGYILVDVVAETDAVAKGPGAGVGVGAICLHKVGFPSTLFASNPDDIE